MIFESELLEIPNNLHNLFVETIELYSSMVTTNNLHNLFVETIELYSSMVVRDVVHTFS